MGTSRKEIEKRMLIKRTINTMEKQIQKRRQTGESERLDRAV